MKSLFKTNRHYRLHTKLKIIKIWLYNILENETSPYNQLYNMFALFLVITSSFYILAEIFLENIKIPKDLDEFVEDYDFFVLFFLTIEYITRFWVISDFLPVFNKVLDENEDLPEKKRYLLALKEALKPKIKWMLTPTALIDLIAILPILRPLRAFRILIALRLLKILRYSRALKGLIASFKEHGYLFIFIFLTISFWIMIFSTLVYIVEYNKDETTFKSFKDALYWGIITISTVGYGDISPKTYEGKLLTSIMIIGGIILFSALTGLFSATLVSRLIAIKEGSLKMDHLENHIVICGWNETTEEIIEQILSYRLDKEKPIVLITNIPKNQIGISLPKTIFYKKGDFIQENVLMEVGIDKAEHVLIMAEREENLSERNIDARTALVSMLVRTLNPNCHLYVEVLLDEDANIFERRINIQEIIIHGQILGKILFASLLNPGITDLLNSFVDREKGIKKYTLEEINETSKIKYSTFGEILKEARKYDYLALAVERDGRVILNPNDSFKLRDDDYIFFIPSAEGED